MTSNISKLTIPQQAQGQDGDIVDLCKEMQNLSPTKQESLGVLLRSISKGEAQIDYDRHGKQFIDYKHSKKLWWDGSYANVTAVPKSDEDVQVKVDACLELIDFFKTEKPPSGVLLDRTKISLTPLKDYREGHEFVRTKYVLGTGNCAGDIMVVKDTKTGTQHAHKTMMISEFRKEEVKCWVDMSATGYVPCLYYFKVVKNRVHIHMEILHGAKTLRSIIDDQMRKFYDSQESVSLIKPFSLFVLDGALEAVSTLHSKGWLHKDLHAGNVMVQPKDESSLHVKILDFGSAGRLEGPQGVDYRGFQADIAETVRLFYALYTGREFDNTYELRQNWRKGLSEDADYRNMSTEDRQELFCLVDAALGIVTPSGVQEYRHLVKEKLSEAVGERETEIMKQVVALLFREQFAAKQDQQHRMKPVPAKSVLTRGSLQHGAAQMQQQQGQQGAMIGQFTTPAGMVHGMQSKTITAGVSANPHHFSLANQNAASSQVTSSPHSMESSKSQLANTNGDDKTAQASQQQPGQVHLTNTKEKTPMCLINELARYNKVTHQYTLVDEQGPAHKKTFFVKLQLGDKEEYSASGPSIKKAQHAAAGAALEKTEDRHPPPKPNTGGYIEEDQDGNSITPTVELNAVAMKRGEPAVYKNIENRNPQPMYYHHNYDFGGMYNQRYHYMRGPRMFYVSLKVGTREFIGEGNTRQMARHNAAKKALEILRNLPLPPDAAGDRTTNNSVEKTDIDEDEDKSKSEISMVHEIALRHNLPVTFDVTRESGPPHMKTFITQCLVGHFKTEAEGNSKKLSKKRAAEMMLKELRVLPQIPPTFRPKTKPVAAKKKNRNLIKMQKADPTYGVGVNPISRLIQIQQGQKKKEPLYSLLAERGMPRRREFVMQVQVDDYTCTGVGPNKKLAKRHAAEAMLTLLGYNKPSPQPAKPAIKMQGDSSLHFSDNTEDSSPGQVNGQGGRQMIPGLLVLPDGSRNSYSQMKSHGGHGHRYGGMGSGYGAGKVNYGMRPEQKLRETCARHNIDVKYDEFSGSNNLSEFLCRVYVGSNPPHTLHGSGPTPEAARDAAAITALKILVESGLVKDEMLMSATGDGSQG